MRAMMRILPLSLLVLAALLFAACLGAEGSDDDDSGDGPAAADNGGGSGDDSSDDADGGDDGSGDDSDGSGDSSNAFPGIDLDDEAFVSNGVEVLTASADEFSQDITSMDGGLEMQMTGQGLDMSVTADFAFQSPDKMYMSLQMSGDDGSGIDLGTFGDMEFLIRDNVYYMNVPFFGGWVSMSLEDVNLTEADIQEMQSMLSTSSAFDYQALVDELGGIDFVGEEELNGRDTLHYSVSVDLQDAIDSLGGFDAGGLGFDEVPVDDVTGPIQLDIWVGADDLLPYQVTMEVDVTVPGEGEFSMDMLMHVDSYNGDVTIPAAPADATPFEDLFGGLFSDTEGGLGGLEDLFSGS